MFVYVVVLVIVSFDVVVVVVFVVTINLGLNLVRGSITSLISARIHLELLIFLVLRTPNHLLVRELV